MIASSDLSGLPLILFGSVKFNHLGSAVNALNANQRLIVLGVMSFEDRPAIEHLIEHSAEMFEPALISQTLSTI